MDFMLEMREYDVPYHMRVAIDLKFNCAKWYDVKCSSQAEPTLTERADLLDTSVAIYARCCPGTCC